jgi:uncharacterized protein YgbK (DUF1537 family)
MTESQVHAALKAWREALDAADALMAKTIAQATVTITEARRARDAAVLLATSRAQRILDAEDGDARITVALLDTECVHDRMEDGAAGISGCCADAGSDS